MTTAAQLRDRILNQLSDPSNVVWSDAVIEEWIKDGIRDYTQFISRIVQGVQIISSGTFDSFSLPEDFRAMANVRHFYDTLSQERVLTRVNRDESRFINQAGYYYDVLTRRTMDENSVCYLSFDVNGPGTAENITYEYEGDHSYWYSDPSDELTIPWRDEPVIIQFVIWRAWLERATKESQSPDSTTLLLATHATNADKAERTYRRMLKQAQEAHQSKGVTPVPWKMDKWDRSY